MSRFSIGLIAAALLSAVAQADQSDHGIDHFRLAQSLAKAGDCRAAMPAFERSIELGVDGGRGGLRAAHIEAARCAASLGRDAVALQHLREAQGRLGFKNFAELRLEPAFSRLAAAAAFKSLAADPEPGLNRVAAWRSDLAYFDDLVRRRHPNPFHRTSEQAWAAAVRKLHADIPKLDEVGVIGRFMQLAALIGDGHTAVYPRLEGEQAFHLLPIWPYRLGANWYVLAATPAHRNLVGQRIRSINGQPMRVVESNLRKLLPADNDRTIGFVGVTALQFAEIGVLAANGSAGPVEVEVEERDGRTHKATLAPGPIDRDPTAPWPPEDWPGVASRRPAWLAHTTDAFYVEEQDAGTTIYAQINRIADGEQQSFAAFSRQLGRRLTSTRIKRLIIDLRHNNGGSGSLNWTLVREIVRASSIDRPGGLFVITGSRTFSAAMNLASMLETHTNAIFVGEPTGSRPNFFGEDTDFTLPNSRLTGSISSAWFQGGLTSDDQRPFIAPELPAPLTMEALQEGRDPALDAIREYSSRGD